MSLTLRQASLEDLAVVLPRTRALQDHEGIEIADAALERALRTLLADRTLGDVFLVEEGGGPIGYAIVTYGYDLEFGGTDCYLTELWIDAAARNHGAGSKALELVAEAARRRGAGAMHLQVRHENPAVRLYERAGFKHPDRYLMTRRL